MPRIRYTGPIEELIIQPPGVAPFPVTRLEWFDADAEVAKGLLSQPDWETETKGARAKTDKENS